MPSDVKAPLAVALEALGTDPAAAELFDFTPAPAPLPSRLAVDEIAAACIGSALLMASELSEARGGPRLDAALDGGEMQAAIRSERYFRVDGEPSPAGFAPQSRFWPTADGWVRTHANFPWHLKALLEALGAPDVEALGDLIASMPAAEIEAKVFAAGGIAAAVRTPEEWRSGPQGAAVAAEPLIARERLGDAPPRRDRERSRALGSPRSADGPASSADWAPGGDLPAPAAGIRVLDLTRVIAGPICTRYLGALGAEVLRLDPPGLPDLEPGAPFDTLLGKRSAFLDLASEGASATLEALLTEADVVVQGYRPGSLDRFGLAPADLAERHPGIVVVSLSAWGHSGPWAGRRGFDSIVQAPSGIAAIEAKEDGSPGALPCQLLDHGTGYLAAAAALAALAEQRREGGSHLRRLSLARVANWLLDTPTGEAEGSSSEPAPSQAGAAESAPVPEPDPPLVDVSGPLPVSAVPPPGRLGGSALRWPEPNHLYGADPPRWSH